MVSTTKRMRQGVARAQSRGAIDQLSEQQREFVRVYVWSGGNVSVATRAANYSQNGIQLLRSPTICAAIRQEQARAICGELASVAIGTIRDVMRDATARNSDKLTAARLALEAARFIGRAVPVETATRDKPVSEMTAAELDTMIAETQQALQQLRDTTRTIEHAGNPHEPGTTAMPVPVS